MNSLPKQKKGMQTAELNAHQAHMNIFQITKIINVGVTKIKKLLTSTTGNKVELEEALTKMSCGSKKISVIQKHETLGVWVLNVNGMPVAVDAKEAKKLITKLKHKM